MMDRAASEWFACGVSLAWLISLNEEIDPHNLSRFHNILALLRIMGSDGRGGVTSISVCHNNWADCGLDTQGRVWLQDRWQKGLSTALRFFEDLLDFVDILGHRAFAQRGIIVGFPILALPFNITCFW